MRSCLRGARLICNVNLRLRRDDEHEYSFKPANLGVHVSLDTLVHAPRLSGRRRPQLTLSCKELREAQDVSRVWELAGNVSNAKIKQSLEDLVTLRGEIAHRVVSSRSVLKRDVEAATELVQRLAVTSSNVVRQFLLARGKWEPWQEYSYGVPRMTP